MKYQNFIEEDNEEEEVSYFCDKEMDIDIGKSKDKEEEEEEIKVLKFKEKEKEKKLIELYNACFISI